MIGHIADIMRESLSAKLKAAKYIAVLIDGDTDISNTECEIVYVRLLEDGKPVNLLVGQQTFDHSHAIGVLDATKAAFRAVCPEEDGGSWMKKCISFGADGASINMGHRGVVIAHLQRESGGHIIPIHSMPHRALKVFLRHGQDKDLATDEGQYSVVLQHMEHLAVASTTVEVQGRAKKGDLKGFMDLTNPQLKQHIEAAINIGVDDFKARFGGLLKDEGVQIPVESFRVLNPDTWPEDQASLLTFGDDGVADLMRHFKEPLES
ncbi:uncharacterized protein ACWYII_019880 [Salvelinus alpinus]